MVALPILVVMDPQHLRFAIKKTLADEFSTLCIQQLHEFGSKIEMYYVVIGVAAILVTIPHTGRSVASGGS